MLGDVLYPLSIDVDGPPVAETLQVLLTRQQQCSRRLAHAPSLHVISKPIPVAHLQTPGEPQVDTPAVCSAPTIQLHRDKGRPGAARS